MIGRVLAGKYELLELIGKGGAGLVYAAVQHPLERAVAVKMLRDDVSEDGREEMAGRFLREAAVTARLSHPNLVTVYDFGQSKEGERFVVMELLVGRTLKAAMRGALLPAHEAVRIAVGVLRGLRHAHGQDLVHRDIKPSNIFLVKDDDGVEQPKILDFGLVKGADSDMTRSGTYMGTPTYVAPEQARGSTSIDHRADQYSLGVVLYRALTGVVPFRAEGPMATAVAHITQPYPAMTVRAPAVVVDPSLEAIVERAMAKDPDARFDSSAQMALALAEWSGSTLSLSSIVLARPPPVVPAKANARPMLAGLAAGGGLSVLALVGAAVCVGVFLSQTPDPAASTLAETFPALEHVDEPVPLVDELPGPVTEPVPSEVPAPITSPPVVARSPVEVVAPALLAAPVPAPIDLVAPVPAPIDLVAPVPAPIDLVAPVPAPIDLVTPVPIDLVAPELVATRPAAAPSGESSYVDGVSFDADHASRALIWLNSADEAAVRASGVYGRGVTIVLEQRPFASIEAFGATPYVGEKTVQAVAEASR